MAESTEPHPGSAIPHQFVPVAGGPEAVCTRCGKSLELRAEPCVSATSRRTADPWELDDNALNVVCAGCGFGFDSAHEDGNDDGEVTYTCPACGAQPTPGPWHRCEAQPDAVVGPRCEPGTCVQCDEVLAGWHEDESEALPRTYGDHFGGHFVCESVSGPDADLVIAAPELLAALKNLLACADATGPGVPMIRLAAAAVESLDTLIARAEGRDAE